MLGEVLDDGCLDDKGGKLDLSMIEYVKGTTSLKLCRRSLCMLCHQKGLLKKSHLWPESLLCLFRLVLLLHMTRKIFIESVLKEFYILTLQTKKLITRSASNVNTCCASMEKISACQYSRMLFIMLIFHRHLQCNYRYIMISGSITFALG